MKVFKNYVNCELIPLFFSIFPIISFYQIKYNISYSIFVSIICVILIMVANGKLRTNMYLVKHMYVVFFVVTIFSLISFFTYEASNSLINSVIIFDIQWVSLLFLFPYSKYETFIKYYKRVSLIVLMVVFLQVIQQYLNIDVYDGQLPLRLMNGQGWMIETYGFRFNSLLPEPSYLAIFLAPNLLIYLHEKNYKKFILICIGIILSSSSLGFLLIGVSIFYYFFTSKIENKNKIRFIIFVLITAISLIVLVNKNDYLHSLFYRSINKINDISNDSQLRISGNLEYFNQLKTFNLFFGVGLAQLANYLSTLGILTSNYSNGFIIILFNYGVVGLILILGAFFSWKNIYENKGFLLQFFCILCFDTLVFNGLFYLYLFLFLSKKEEDRQ